MRDAVSSGQPSATSLRACAKSTRESFAISEARTTSKPRSMSWSRRQTVVDVVEPERFEPPRGSGAHVSLVVPAIHDHGPRPLELLDGLPVQLLQRDVDGAR